MQIAKIAEVNVIFSRQSHWKSLIMKFPIENKKEFSIASNSLFTRVNLMKYPKDIHFKALNSYRHDEFPA